MKAARCPECGSTTLDLFEMSEAWQHFTQTDGVIDPEGWNSHGNIIKVEVKCPCGHRWKLRDVAQVTELAGYPKP